MYLAICYLTLSMLGPTHNLGANDIQIFEKLLIFFLIQIFIDILFGFSMKNAFKWVSTQPLHWSSGFGDSCIKILKNIQKFNFSTSMQWINIFCDDEN